MSTLVGFCLVSPSFRRATAITRRYKPNGQNVGNLSDRLFA